MLFLLSACLITNADIDKRVDRDGDGHDDDRIGGDDCRDDDASIHPGAVESCDGIDSDCDGEVEDVTDADGDGVTVCEGDCDDDDAAVAPGRVEACDGIDNDCDGAVDEGLPESSFFRDADDDGYGDPDAPPQLACFPPDGYVDDDSDCDDTDHTLNPDTVWYRDLDDDGTGDATSTRSSCEEPDVPGVLYVRTAGDCDDGDPESYPGRAEVGTALACNGVDNDCDPSTASDELVDVDGDGAPLCGDCDDDDPHVYPDLVWWLDVDGDGFGAGSQQIGCPGAVSFATVDGDCDDHAPDLNPDTPWYLDGDDDGAGDPAHITLSCLDPSDATDTWLRSGGDCDDADPTAFPANDDLGERACNGVDNDCDPSTAPDELVDADNDTYVACEDCDETDDRFPALTWYADADLDGVGTGAGQAGCPADDHWSAVDGDCDDTAPLVSSTAFTVDGTADLNAILAQVCPSTTITLADPTAISQALTFGRDVSLVAAGSATLTGDVLVTAAVGLDGVDIEGVVEVQDGELTWTDGQLDGTFDASGGEVVLSQVDVSMGTVGSVFSGTRVDFTDVVFDGVLADQEDAVTLQNATAGSSLARVEIHGSGQPMQGRIGLFMNAIAPNGVNPISVKNLLITDMAVGMEIAEQAVDLQFVTIADYFAQGLVVRGTQAVAVQDSIIGRPRGYMGQPPPDYWAINVDGTPPLTFDTTYTFVDANTQDIVGATVNDGTGAFATCEALDFPGSPADIPRCEQVLDRTDDVNADLTVARPVSMQGPAEFLFGRIADQPGDCPELAPPGMSNPDPDDCFQPGYYGGIDGPPLP